MPIDLEERLSLYRVPLDQAIAADLAERKTEPAGLKLSKRNVMLSLAASSVVVVGLAALAWAPAQSSRPMPVVGSPDPSFVVDSRDPSSTGLSAETAPPQRDEAADSAPLFESDDSLVPEPFTRLAIGDQVMLGAAPQLADAGFNVDASESRTFVDLVEIVALLDKQDRLGDVVVVGLGTNGQINENDMESVMQALRDVPTVVFLTVRVDRDYAAPNNRLIRSLPEKYQNAVVLDWATAADACPGNCFYDDEINIRPDGQNFYKDLVVALLDDATS